MYFINNNEFIFINEKNYAIIKVNNFINHNNL